MSGCSWQPPRLLHGPLPASPGQDLNLPNSELIGTHYRTDEVKSVSTTTKAKAVLVRFKIGNSSGLHNRIVAHALMIAKQEVTRPGTSLKLASFSKPSANGDIMSE